MEQRLYAQRATALLRIGALALAILFGPISSKVDAIEIRMERGGLVDEWVQKVRSYERQNVPVRITGTCLSACTMLLGLSNSCVSPRAKLGFHGPSTRSGIPLTWENFDRISRQMADFYPPKIRAWFIAEARLVTRDYVAISGAEAIRMGARACT